MTTECYYSQCPHHCTQETPPDEGPFCHHPECKATDAQFAQWGRERRLKRLGYDPDELEADNPYNQWMKGTSMSFIYLASPYSSPDPDLMQRRYEVTRAHVAAALRAGVTLFSPIVHCHPLANAHTLPVDFDFWQAHNEAMLAEASDLYVLILPGWKTSKGVAAEMQFARQREIPIRLVSPEEDLTCHPLSA